MKQLVFIILTVCFFVFHDSYTVYLGCPTKNLFLYGLCHANLLHLAANLYAWCKLYDALRFLHPAERALWLFAGSAVSGMVAHIPTTGISGGCFFLIGMQFGFLLMRGRFEWENLLIYLAGIGVTFFLPKISAIIHLAGFTSGILIGIVYGFTNRDFHRYGGSAYMG